MYRRARLEKARQQQSQTFDAVMNARATAGNYLDQPKVAAIVQHFNKRDNIVPICQALAAAGIDEQIFIDDGSMDCSFETFLAVAKGKNDFVIRANDIFEVRTYNRAIDFCRAEFVILLQDDDLPPSNGKWVEEALTHFAADPNLAILGGRVALKLRPESAAATGLAYDTIELQVGAPLRYVEVVNRAPMILRKEAWRALGGIDQTFAPFQCDDVDICLRAWQSGLRVGLMHTDFVRDIGVGGMRLFNAEKVSGQAVKNWSIIRDRYLDPIASGWFAEQVAAAGKAG
jgi:glycosyltransferase involved in cell wall biosynthesis